MCLNVDFKWLCDVTTKDLCHSFTWAGNYVWCYSSMVGSPSQSYYLLVLFVVVRKYIVYRILFDNVR